jgi:iron(III) transport system ATP-binding protein
MPDVLPLTIAHLNCFYQEQPVLHDINLEVKPGEFMAILGPSGCGKSTLLRLISGLAIARFGEIKIAGKVMTRNGVNLVPVEKRSVGLVFQDYALFPFQTVRENIGFGVGGDRTRVDELLKLIHMSHLADRLPCQLSGGQQQRVALARALAPRPHLLLLDEPFANVDTTLRQELIRALQQLVKHENTSVIFVTHDRFEAFALAHRVAILMPSEKGSHIVQCDSPEKVYQEPANHNVALLAGAAFLLPAQAKGNTAQTTLGTVPLQNPQIGSGEVVIRPEMATFIANEKGNAIILSSTFQGCHYHLLCDTPGGQLYTETRSKIPPPVGTRGIIEMIEPCWFLPSIS